MHPYVTAKAPLRRRAPVLPGAVCLMHMTVAACAVTSLRKVVERVCGDALQFIRIEACVHSGQMRVRVCVTKTMSGPVEEAIRRAQPDTRFEAAVDASLAHLARPALQ